MIDLTFLPMLYTWTNASILSYVTTVSYTQDLIPDICRQHLNNSELHKYLIGMISHILANTNIS